MIAVERCGLYDGILIDGFNKNGLGFIGRNRHPATDEEIIQAILNIFRAVRAQTRDDFLIIVNANDSKPTRFTELINGTFMETGKDHPGGYTYDSLRNLESVLLWAEENLREPQITCLEGAGMSIEPPDGPNNRRWMRAFTTMSLTHSDGYVLYTDGQRDLGTGDHLHLWHDFWDTDLGYPVGEKPNPIRALRAPLSANSRMAGRSITAVGQPKQSHCQHLLPLSPIGEITLRHLPTCSPTSTAKSISQPKASPMSIAMEGSMSWIWCRLPTGSASRLQTPTAMGKSTSSIWSSSPSSSANNINSTFLSRMAQ